MKTIFFIAINRFIFTNIINTDVFKKFVQQPDLRIVLFVPDYKKDFFMEQVRYPNVIIEGVAVNEILGKGRSHFFQELSKPLIPGCAIDWRIDELRYKGYYRAYAFSKLLNLLCARSALAHRIFRAIDKRMTPYGFLKPYIERYQPEAIVATDIFNECDAFLLMEADAMGLKTYGLTRSWDNATTKGLLRFVPQRIIATSPYVKYELIQYHGVDKDAIDVGGYPQYDAFVRAQPLSRADFCQRLGLDPAKKIILFGPAGTAFHGTDIQILENLKRMVETGELPDGVQFLVRTHPLSQIDFSQWQPHPQFVIDMPGTHFKANHKASEMTREDIEHLVNSLYHSDIVMYGVSSLCLDATIFLKPQIMLAIDGDRQRHYLESLRRYQDEEHLQYFRRTGAVKMADSWASLAHYIQTYLKNPDTDKENRQRAYREILLNHDGNSGSTIARLLSEYVNF